MTQIQNKTKQLEVKRNKYKARVKAKAFCELWILTRSVSQSNVSALSHNKLAKTMVKRAQYKGSKQGSGEHNYTNKNLLGMVIIIINE